MVRLILLVGLATGPAHAAEPILECPSGTRLREEASESICVAPGGLPEGPMWGRFPEGGLRYYGTSRKGRTHGTWRSWHRNGARSTEATYVDGELVGRFQMWDGNGQLLYAGDHDARGQMTGTWLRWWPNGRRRMKWEMRDGQQQGPVEGWYESGARRMQGQRVDNQPDGPWTWWSEDGARERHCRYERGRVVEGECGPPPAAAPRG